MQHFAPQLHPDHHSASLRAIHYRRKRKHRHDDIDDDNNDADNDHDNDHDNDNHIPPLPFPHAPATLSRPYLRTATIQKELAAPPSRLFTHPNSPSSHPEPPNLRRTHLNVLSTIMHRCLLQRDYHRAARAWGMILRTQAPHGNTIDLRNHGRWAIGAEILLHKTPTPDQGFELAKDYYDRLIVQHPARKQAPHAVDQRSFYPAMFSLWIQQVCHKSKRAREHTANANDNHETAIQADELAQATLIAHRLDDLVASPPFDKQPSLLHLRAHLALWTSDLLVGNSSATVLEEWDLYPLYADVPTADQMTRFKNCQRELHVAQSFLARVEENGGPSQLHLLNKIDLRLKELQRQMARLEDEADDDDDDDDTNVSMRDAW